MTSTSASASALHIKALGIDDDRIFVGSANADPRSVWWNTEIGVLATSPGLAAELHALAEDAAASIGLPLTVVETGDQGLERALADLIGQPVG